MTSPSLQRALIVGAGPGLSASVARLFSRYGMQVALAARDSRKLEGLAGEIGAPAFECDASRPGEVQRLFAAVDKAIGEPDVVVYNASGRVRGAFVDLDPAAVERAIAVSAY